MTATDPTVTHGFVANRLLDLIADASAGFVGGASSRRTPPHPAQHLDSCDLGSPFAGLGRPLSYSAALLLVTAVFFSAAAVAVSWSDTSQRDSASSRALGKQDTVV